MATLTKPHCLAAPAQVWYCDSILANDMLREEVCANSRSTLEKGRLPENSTGQLA